MEPILRGEDPVLSDDRGVVEIHGEEHPGTHSALVSEEVWYRLEKDRASKARTRSGGKGRPVKGAHLMTNGLLRCAHCQSAMLPRSDHGTYICDGRGKNGPESCPQTPVPRAAVDDAVFRQFETQAIDLGAMAQELAG